MRDITGSLEVADEFTKATKELCGDLSTEYAESLYLKAKAQYNDPG